MEVFLIKQSMMQENSSMWFLCSAVAYKVQFVWCHFQGISKDNRSIDYRFSWEVSSVGIEKSDDFQYRNFISKDVATDKGSLHSYR